MLKQVKKLPYVAPTLELTEYEVEHGFALSQKAYVREEITEFTGDGTPWSNGQTGSGTGGSNGEYEEGLWY